MTIEERIRRAAEHRARRATVSSDAYARIMQRAARADARARLLRWVAAAGAAVVLIVLVPGVLSVVRPDNGMDVAFTAPPAPQGSPPAPSPAEAATPPGEAETAPPSTEAAGQGWRRVVTDAFAVDEFTSVADVAAGPDGVVVAVGSSSPGMASYGQAWRSEDAGATWSRVEAPGVSGPDDGITQLLAVAGHPKVGFVAVGESRSPEGPSDGEGAQVWTSPDGLTWQAAALPEGTYGRDVAIDAGSGAVWVAGEGPGREGRIWTSVDAGGWRVAVAGGDVIDHIALGAEVIVGLGRDGVWRGAGDDWAWTAKDEAGFAPGTSAFDGLAVDSSGLLAAAVSGADEPILPVLYRSADGISWGPTATLSAVGEDTHRVADLAVVDGEVLAVGQGPGPDGGTIALAWRERDGAIDVEQLTGGTAAEALSTSGPGLLVVGAVSEAEGAVWVMP